MRGRVRLTPWQRVKYIVVGVYLMITGVLEMLTPQWVRDLLFVVGLPFLGAYAIIKITQLGTIF